MPEERKPMQSRCFAILLILLPSIIISGVRWQADFGDILGQPSSYAPVSHLG
jgi:hypothetical protein